MKTKIRLATDLNPWRDWRRLLWIFGLILLGCLVAAYLGLNYLNRLAIQDTVIANEPSGFSSLTEQTELIDRTAEILNRRAAAFERWRTTPPTVVDPGRAGL